MIGEGSASVDELRTHSATIGDILEAASQRVERLAAEEAESPELLEAIRHELSLSRRWNRHVGAILVDVAEARRALSEREREAAEEIGRLTMAAEEARLELVALRKLLQDAPSAAKQHRDTWPESGLDRGALSDHHDGSALNRPLAEVSTELGAERERRALQDAREMLEAMQESQKAAARDVDAVRGRIIKALQTLAAAQGGRLTPRFDDGAGLSSEDITGWAVSTATRLGRTSGISTE